jgi:3'(2'), 5'-bisphosphate nucleotidase/myo-inositol-1(or 4)-monophosphatase
MKLENEHLLDLAERAMLAAREAGALIAEHASRPVEVKTKANAPSRASEVVTEVDFMSQEAILDILKPTCEEYDLALLSEEQPDDPARLLKDAFWCIDPMDGTLCFVEGTPGYAVSIGLTARSGEPLLGVVFDPVEQVLYHAIAGVGAFRNGEPLRIEQSSKMLSLVSDSGFVHHPRFNEIMAGLETIASELGLSGVKTQFQGGAAMCSCWVMERAPACYFKFPKSEDGGGSLWDYAATACIAQEAGAFVSDSFGDPLDLNRPDSTYMNHRGMIYASNTALAERIVELGSRL